MDYLKKNLVFIISAAILLIVLIVFTVLMVSTNNERKYYLEEREKIIKNFRDMNNLKLKINTKGSKNTENLNIAKANMQTATQYYDDVKKELLERFCVTPNDLPATPVMAQNKLQSKLRQLQEMIVRSNIVWNCGPVGDKLHNLSVQNVPIAISAFPMIFRQLKIYEKILTIVLKTEITSVDMFFFPSGMKVTDAQDYTVTSIALSVSGSAESIQKLVNDLTKCPDMLLFIKSIEFSVPGNADPATMYSNIVMQRQNKTRQEIAPDFGSNQPDQPPPPGGNSRRRRRNRQIESETNNQPSAVQTEKNDNEQDWVKEEPKRQDYLVFQADGIIHMNLSLDLIEYKKPEKPN